MGQFKKSYLDEYESKPKAPIRDRYLCSAHLKDYAIKAEVLKWAILGRCSYCGRRRRVALYKDILPFIKKGVFRFYSQVEDESVYFDKEDDAYFGFEPMDTYEVLDDSGLESDEPKLMEDLVDSFGAVEWCYKDPYGDDENVELSYNWKEFKRVVKHKARFVFLGSKQFKSGLNGTSVDHILHEIGRRVDQLNLFKWIDVGTKLYRCRQHDAKTIINQARDFSSPPENLALYPNRMSPSGIPMFYCAFDKKTAFSETVDLLSLKNDRMSTAVFTNKNKLYLLNLTTLPPIPSRFDEKLAPYLHTLIFLHSFVQDLSAPISKDGREHIDYVPTQIVTEYFRYTFEELTKIAIDGIIYPSSKHRGHNVCVLFYNQKETLENLYFNGSKLSKKKVKI